MIHGSDHPLTVLDPQSVRECHADGAQLISLNDAEH